MTEERIPGERDPETAAPSQPGIMGDTGFGDQVPPPVDDLMDDATRRERAREGGGDSGQRSSDNRQR